MASQIGDVLRHHWPFHHTSDLTRLDLLHLLSLYNVFSSSNMSQSVYDAIVAGVEQGILSLTDLLDAFVAPPSATLSCSSPLIGTKRDSSHVRDIDGVVSSDIKRRKLLDVQHSAMEDSLLVSDISNIVSQASDKMFAERAISMKSMINDSTVKSFLHWCAIATQMLPKRDPPVNASSQENSRPQFPTAEEIIRLSELLLFLVLDLYIPRVAQQHAPVIAQRATTPSPTGVSLSAATSQPQIAPTTSVLFDCFLGATHLLTILFANPPSNSYITTLALNRPDWWEKINRKLEKTYTQLGAEPFYLPQRAHKELKLLWFSLRCMQTPDYLLFNAPSEWCAIKVLGRDLFVPQTNTCNYPSLQYLLRPQPYGVLFYHQLRNIYSAASASWPSLDLIFSNIVNGRCHRRVESLARELDSLRRIHRTDYCEFYYALWCSAFQIELSMMDQVKRLVDKYARQPFTGNTCHIRWLKARSLLFAKLPTIISYLDNVCREHELGPLFGKCSELSEIEQSIVLLVSRQSSSAPLWMRQIVVQQQVVPNIISPTSDASILPMLTDAEEQIDLLPEFLFALSTKNLIDLNRLNAWATRTSSTQLVQLIRNTQEIMLHYSNLDYRSISFLDNSANFNAITDTIETLRYQYIENPRAQLLSGDEENVSSALLQLSTTLFTQYNLQDQVITLILEILHPDGLASRSLVTKMCEWLCSNAILQLILLHGYMPNLIEYLLCRAIRHSHYVGKDAHFDFGNVFLVLLYALEVCQLNIYQDNRKMVLMAAQRAVQQYDHSSLEPAPDVTGDYTFLTWISEYLTETSNHSRKFASGDAVVEWLLRTTSEEAGSSFYDVVSPIGLLGQAAWIIDRIYALLGDGKITETQVTEIAFSNLQLWCPYFAPVFFLTLARDSTRGPTVVRASSGATVDYAKARADSLVLLLSAFNSQEFGGLPLHAKSVILAVVYQPLKLVVRTYPEFGKKLLEQEPNDWWRDIANFLEQAFVLNDLQPTLAPLIIEPPSLRPVAAIVSSAFYTFLTTNPVDSVSLTQLSDVSRLISPLAFALLLAKEVCKECRENQNPRLAFSRGVRAAEFAAFVVGQSDGDVLLCLLEQIVESFLPDISTVTEGQVWAYFVLLAIIHSKETIFTSESTMQRSEQYILRAYDRFVNFLLTVLDRLAESSHSLKDLITTPGVVARRLEGLSISKGSLQQEKETLVGKPRSALSGAPNRQPMALQTTVLASSKQNSVKSNTADSNLDLIRTVMSEAALIAAGQTATLQRSKEDSTGAVAPSSPLEALAVTFFQLGSTVEGLFASPSPLQATTREHLLRVVQKWEYFEFVPNFFQSCTRKYGEYAQQQQRELERFFAERQKMETKSWDDQVSMDIVIDVDRPDQCLKQP